MLILYHSEPGLTKEFSLQEPPLDEAYYLPFVQSLLLFSSEHEALAYLTELQFQIWRASNQYRDQFLVLRAFVSIERYAHFRQSIENLENYNAQIEFQHPFQTIANATSEVLGYKTNPGLWVRFVTCEIDLSNPPIVSGRVSNQALFHDESKITYKDLNFRSKTEIKIFEALMRRKLLVLPLPIAVMGEMERYLEPDFVVFYKGKAGILEIHGDKWHPPETAAKEHERRRTFTRLGVSVFEIFNADRCWRDPEGVVEEFLKAF